MYIYIVSVIYKYIELTITWLVVSTVSIPTLTHHNFLVTSQALPIAARPWAQCGAPVGARPMAKLVTQTWLVTLW